MLIQAVLVTDDRSYMEAFAPATEELRAGE